MLTSRSKFDEKTKVWSGIETQRLYHPNVSAGQVVLQLLSVNDAEKVIQINDNNGVRVTTGEMRSWMIRAATHYLQKGLQQEDVIGFIVYNSHNVAPLVLASFLNGHTISTLDPQFNKAEIIHIFNITRPKIIFCDYQVYNKLKDAMREIHLDSPVYVVNGKINDVGIADEFLEPVDDELFFLPPKLKMGGEQIAAILCSSGTTGLPKGVCMTHEILLRDSAAMITPNDVFLCFSSLYWFTGVFSIIFSGMYQCARVVTDKPFSPELMLRFIEQYRVTVVLASPTQMAEMVHCKDFESRDLSSVKVFMYVGGAVPKIVVDAIQNRLENGFLLSGYGLTEVGGACTYKFPFDKEGSAGQTGFNQQIKIIDDYGKSLGNNERGEVCVRTNCKPLKYYENLEATKATFDNEGWVHSGDIGYVDEDGNLFIVDRKKDIMKYKGFSLSPTEIESVIITISTIMEVCVCGIPEDDIASDVPAAAVVKKKRSMLTEDDVYQYVAERMADFKKLRAGVYFLDSLPKTPSGKVQRNKVREILIPLYKQKKFLKHKL